MPRSIMDVLSDPPLPLRQDSWAVRGLAIDQRAVLYGMAIEGRMQAPGDLGHYVIDRGRVGDILPGLWWGNAGEGKRATGAWRLGSWPALVSSVGDDGAVFARPILDDLTPGGKEDDDFSEVKLPSSEPLRLVGQRLLVSAGSDTTEEQRIVFQDGGQLVSHWRGSGIDAASTIVYDCFSALYSISGTPFKARLSTGLAVIPRPVDVEAPPGPPPACQLANVLGELPGSPDAGFGPFLGGTGLPPLGLLPAAGGSHPYRVGYAAAERSGPLQVLPASSPYMGDAKCGPMAAGPLALASAALWYSPVGGRTGPMLFEGPYPGAGELPVKHNVHLSYDASISVPWINPTGAPGTPTKGIWRWWGTSSNMGAFAGTGRPRSTSGGSGGGSASGRTLGWQGIAPATFVTEMGVPCLAGQPAPTDAGRWVGVEHPQQPVVWRMETIAASYDAPTSAVRHWVYEQPAGRGRYAGGTARGGCAFAPPDVDELTRTESDRDPVDVHFAAVGGAGLAVCDRLDPQTGAVSAGLQIRRAASGAVQMRMLDADGDADFGTALSIAAFLTLAGGVNATARTVSGQDVTIGSQDCMLVLTPGGANRTVTLPSASDCTRILMIVHGGGANQVQIPAASRNLTAGQGAICISNGSSWYAPAL